MGILTPVACMPGLRSCLLGGTVSLWILILDCQNDEGIVTSVSRIQVSETGFQIRCIESSKIQWVALEHVKVFIYFLGELLWQISVDQKIYETGTLTRICLHTCRNIGLRLTRGNEKTTKEHAERILFCSQTYLCPCWTNRFCFVGVRCGRSTPILASRLRNPLDGSMLRWFSGQHQVKVRNSVDLHAPLVWQILGLHEFERLGFLNLDKNNVILDGQWPLRVVPLTQYLMSVTRWFWCPTARTVVIVKVQTE